MNARCNNASKQTFQDEIITILLHEQLFLNDIIDKC